MTPKLIIIEMVVLCKQKIVFYPASWKECFTEYSNTLDSTVDTLPSLLYLPVIDILFSPSINLDFLKMREHVFGISHLLFPSTSTCIFLALSIYLFIFLIGKFKYEEIYDLLNICKHLCTSSPFQGIKYYYHSRRSLILCPSRSLSLTLESILGSGTFPTIDYFAVFLEL